MLRVFRFCLAVVFVSVSALYPGTVSAAGDRHKVKEISAAVVELAAAPLNGDAASRTFTFQPLGYGRTVFYVFFDYTAQAGTITLTCTASPDANVVDYTLTVCSMSSGVCTLAIDAGVWVTGSLSADTRYVIDADVLGYRDMECIVEHGGSPGATDLITITRDTITQ